MKAKTIYISRSRRMGALPLDSRFALQASASEYPSSCPQWTTSTGLLPGCNRLLWTAPCHEYVN